MSSVFQKNFVPSLMYVSRIFELSFFCNSVARISSQLPEQMEGLLYETFYNLFHLGFGCYGKTLFFDNYRIIVSIYNIISKTGFLFYQPEVSIWDEFTSTVLGTIKGHGIFIIGASKPLFKVVTKLFGGPNNLHIDTFPDYGCHFGCSVLVVLQMLSKGSKCS